MMLSVGEMETNNNNNNSETAYECQCGKQFKRKAPYQRHIEIAHSDTEQHKCKVCAKTFGNASTLTMHMTVHEKQQPFGQTKDNKCITLLQENGDISQIITGKDENMAISQTTSPGPDAQGITVPASDRAVNKETENSSPIQEMNNKTDVSPAVQIHNMASQNGSPPSSLSEMQQQLEPISTCQQIYTTSPNVLPSTAILSQPSNITINTNAQLVNTSAQAMSISAPATVVPPVSQLMPGSCNLPNTPMSMYPQVTLSRPICSVTPITSKGTNHGVVSNLPNGQATDLVNIKQEPLSSDSEDGSKLCNLNQSQSGSLDKNGSDLFGINGSLSHIGLLDSEEEDFEGFEDGKLMPLRKSSRARMANPIWKSLLTGQVYEEVLNDLDGSPDAKRARQEAVSEMKVEDIGGMEVVKSENTENRDPDYLDLDQEQAKKKKVPTATLR